MKARERVLSAVVVLLVVFVAGRLAVKRLLLDPIAAKEQRLGQLRDQRRLKSRNLEDLRRAAVELETWRGRSLPPDVKLAPSLYQDWLTSEAQKVGFDGLDVRQLAGAPTNRGREVVFYSYPFQVKGRTSLKGLVDFLYAFYQAPLLHQVTQLNISPAPGSRAGGLDVIIHVEGVGLVDAEQWVIVPKDTDPASVTLASAVDGRVYRGKRQREDAMATQLSKHPGHELVKVVRTTLLPEPSRDLGADGAGATGSRLAFADRADYSRIVERNIFAPFQAPAAQPDGPDEALYYRLSFVGAELRRGREVPEATLYSPLDDDLVWLYVGDEFEAAGIRGRVVSIGLRDVVLEIGQQRRRLRLGRNLRQLEAVAGAEDRDDDGAESEQPVEEAPEEDS